MKLLCVNAKDVRFINSRNEIILCHGKDLVEGKTFETIGESYFDQDGQELYYIKGVGGRLKIRFTKLLNESVSEKVSKSVEIQIEEALADKNYELAEQLTKQIKKD